MESDGNFPDNLKSRLSVRELELTRSLHSVKKSCVFGIPPTLPPSPPDMKYVLYRTEDKTLVYEQQLKGRKH